MVRKEEIWRKCGEGVEGNERAWSGLAWRGRGHACVSKGAGFCDCCYMLNESLRRLVTLPRPRTCTHKPYHVLVHLPTHILPYRNISSCTLHHTHTPSHTLPHTLTYDYTYSWMHFHTSHIPTPHLELSTLPLRPTPKIPPPSPASVYTLSHIL